MTSQGPHGSPVIITRPCARCGTVGRVDVGSEGPFLDCLACGVQPLVRVARFRIRWDRIAWASIVGLITSGVIVVAWYMIPPL